MPDTERAICKICNLPKQPSKAASLTQWIMVCSCNQRDPDNEQKETLNVCGKCGKRMTAGRKGSFTQWILRADLCSCEFPLVQEIAKEANEPELLEDYRELNEDELALGEGEFPLERFKPIALLGKGAYSSVYLARDRLLNKRVAVKCLYDLKEDQAIKFQKEARLNTELNHPNIAQITDVGQTESSTLYMVIEYFQGRSLVECVEDYGGFKESEVIDIIAQVCSGLEYAHAKNILHHDLKPANILISYGEDNEILVKLIDFGAALIQSTNRKNEKQSLEGTPHYMPPDQPSGKSYDARSEIYSVGCILFELICLRPPFSGESLHDILRKHSDAPVPSVTEYNTTFKHLSEFDTIVKTCLAKEQADRYQTVGELKEAILALKVVDDREVEEGTADSLQSGSKTTGGQRIKLILSLSFLILLGGFAANYLVSKLNKGKEIPVVSEEDSKTSVTRPDPFSDIAPKIEKKYFPKNKKLFVKHRLKKHYLRPNNAMTFTDEDLSQIREGCKKLDLTDCHITGSGFKYLAEKAPMLKELSLVTTKVADENLAYLSDLKYLRVLNLSKTKISSAGLKKLKGLSLTELNLYGCPNIGDDSVLLVSKLFPDLEKFSIGNQALTAGCFKYLQPMKQLFKLHIFTRDLNDDNIAQLAKLPLRRLTIVDAKVTNRGFMKLAESKTLNSVCVENCKFINRYGIDALKQKSNIKKVDIVISSSEFFE